MHRSLYRYETSSKLVQKYKDATDGETFLIGLWLTCRARVIFVVAWEGRPAGEIG